ncbi:MAG: response regulator [Planctomycetes bacterium]|nr:response regulator [Planctomycetota bacterium]
MPSSVTSLSRRGLWLGVLVCLALALEVGFLAVHLSPPHGSSEPSQVRDDALGLLHVAFPACLLAAALLFTAYHFRVQRDLAGQVRLRQREAEARETIVLLAQRHVAADDLDAFLRDVPRLVAERLGAARVELELAARDGQEAVRLVHGPATTPGTRRRSVSILGAGEVIGALHVSRPPGPDDPRTSETLLVLSSYLAAAIDRMRAAEDLRRARDEALESARLKSEFLATMSHEIRTPLHGVLGMNSLLLDTDLSPEQREYAEVVRRSSEHLLTLLNDILDLSKIEADRLELEVVEFDLCQAVRETVGFLAEAAEQKGLALSCRLHSGLPRTVRGDPVRLRQVVLNLVGNAVKFTERGGVEVRASAEPCAGPEVQVRFEVIDTGPGVPAAVQGRLFEPFTQADSSTTRRHGGSGLGLAICRRLTSLMGGEIGLQSAPGEGSRFWFTARFEARGASARITSTRVSQVRLSHPRGTRAERRPAASDLGPVEAAPARPQDERRPTVLVAEDNPINQRLAVRMLERLGFQAEVAGNGEEAVRAVAARDFACVLMDCQMPVVDGYEATARIRAAWDGVRPRTPIIALTASAMQGDRERCLAVGMDDHLPKPVRPDALRAALESVLGPGLAAGAAWGSAARAG